MKSQLRLLLVLSLFYLSVPFNNAQARAQSTPPTPTGLEIDCVTNGSVELGYVLSAASTGVYIERAEGAGSFVRIDSVSGCTCSGQNSWDYFDQTVVPGKQYFYRIQAYNSKHGSIAVSSYSNVVVVNTPAVSQLIARCYANSKGDPACISH